jgi:hypothetical protein
MLPGLIELTCTPTIAPSSYFGRMRAWEKMLAGRQALDAALNVAVGSARLGALGGATVGGGSANRGVVVFQTELLALRAVLQHDAATLDPLDLGAVLELATHPDHHVFALLQVLHGRPREFRCSRHSAQQLEGKLRLLEILLRLRDRGRGQDGYVEEIAIEDDLAVLPRLGAELGLCAGGYARD